MGFFTIPVVERKPWGIIIAVLNILPFPLGLGTLIAGGYERNWKTVVLGLLMMFVLFIGWIYSVIWGVMVLIKSTSTTPSAAPTTTTTTSKSTKGRAKKA